MPHDSKTILSIQSPEMLGKVGGCGRGRARATYTQPIKHDESAKLITCGQEGKEVGILTVTKSSSSVTVR